VGAEDDVGGIATKRRRLLALAALAPWLAQRSAPTRAQAPDRLPRVVMIAGAGAGPFAAAFLDGMREAGQVEGRTFRFETRLADEPGRMPALVREAVAERAHVLVVGGLSSARAAKEATSTIPVVVGTASDLVEAGVVKSYARPGGNITGVSDLVDVAAVKRLEYLKAALPHASRVALLVNPGFPATPRIVTRVQSAASSMGIAVVRIDAGDRASLLRAIDSLATSRPDALLVGGDPLFNISPQEWIDKAATLRIPVVHYWPGTAESGALLSYQTDVADNFRRAAGYVDKILKGAKPGDLPIHQPTRYELIVNAGVARTLGLTLPQSFLLRADQVIE
jgi:putative ABC transport system substrate-binding protein